MTRSNRFSTKQLVLVALLAALTCVGSSLRIKVPADVVGTSAFHLGNILCALSGILLGPWLGGLAAGLGSAIYDMLDPLYIKDCWLTFLMKGSYGLVVGLVIRSGKGSWNYGKATVATVAGAVTYALLYLSKGVFYDGMLFHGLTFEAGLLSIVSKLPATGFNAAVAIIGAPVLALALRSALKKSHLSLE